MERIPVAASRWVTTCLDPYHDYAVEVEGMPDKETGRSYVRVHNQAFTVSPTADGDNLAIIFTGFHGVHEDTQATLDLDISGTSVQVRPFLVLRAPSGTDAGVYSWASSSGTSKIGAWGTAMDRTLPSRLVGLAVEVHDVTAQLYRKGTLTCVHCTGMSYDRSVYRTSTADTQSFFCDIHGTACLPGTLSDMQHYPGVYTGSLSKGVYVVGRLREPQPPVTFKKAVGDHGTGQFMIRENDADEIQSLIPGAATMADLSNERGMFESGFQPIVIRLSGVPAEGEYRVTFRTIVEYFPEPTDPTALGIATPSPPNCPEAMVAYHNAVVHLATAVPVGANAAGDYWRMVIQALRRYAPAALQAGATAATVLGRPDVAAIANAVAAAIPKPRTRPAPPKPKKKNPIKK